MTHHFTESDNGVIVNEGAEKILCNSTQIASLLPVGVLRIKGEFKKGDLVQIYNEKEQKIGLGMAAYNSNKLADLLGKQNEKAFIHYDYLLIH